MKYQQSELENLCQTFPNGVLAILVYGPDAGHVNEVAMKISKSTVDDITDPFSVVEVGSDKAKQDPAFVIDAALAYSMIGERRLVRIRNATDNITPIIENVIQLESIEAKIILDAGALDTRSKLRSLFEKNDRLGILACYGSQGKTLESLIKNRLTGNNITFDPETIEYLIAHLGNDHQGICSLRDVIEKNNKVYLVFDFVKGVAFDSWVSENGVLSESAARQTAREMLNALKYVHERGVIHRDVKPENILVKREQLRNKDDPRFVLIDFGMASEFDPNNGIGSLTGQAGSPSYVAPEVIDPGTYNNKADLWSCGVIMYILLSGSSPFAGKTADATMDLIKSGNYSMDTEEWDDVSSKAKEVIRKLLIVDPLERASATEAKSLSFFEGIDDTNKCITKRNSIWISA